MPSTAITDLERRTLGNLSIPRNVGDLLGVLRADQYSGVRGHDEASLGKFLGELEGHGLVVRLGAAGDDLPKLAARVADGTKGSLPLGDVKARNYCERLQAPTREWRTWGDLWVLSQGGFDVLHLPTTSTEWADRHVVEAMLAEAARAVKDLGLKGSIHDEDSSLRKDEPLLQGVMSDSGRVTATMLPEEYAEWAKSISDAYAADHPGEPPLRHPMAGGAGYGNATEDLIQDADVGKASYTETAPTFMALVTVAVTDADTGSTITETTGYTGYARKSAAAADFGASSTGSRTNANAIVYANATAGSANAIGFARCTAATLGRVIRYGTCASTTISATQTPAQFAAAALTDTLD